MTQLDFTLSFEQNDWVCYDQNIRFQANTLDLIDAKLQTHINNHFPSGKYKVKMYFDFEHFPKWHRQYMPHYFNRELYFNLK